MNTILEYTAPPERLQSLASDRARLPEALAGLVADPAAYRYEEGLVGALADRLCSLPAAPAPVPSVDGEVEQLGGGVSVTHRFVDAPGDSEQVRWHLVECGPTDGEVVVFLHGVPDSWFQWRHALVALAPTYRCIAIDLKGYGQSDKRTGDYRQRGVAEQLIALLDRLGIDRFSLVTHDRGTPPGDHLVAMLGERVVRYGRGQQHLWHLHPSLHPQELMFTSPAAPTLLADARVFVTLAYTMLTARPVTDADLLRTITEFSHEAIPSAVPRYFHSSSFRQEWIDRRGTLIDAWRCPVLLLQGRDDPNQPHEFYTDPDVLAKLPAGSDVHLFDAGHFWPFEAPSEMVRVLTEFLGRRL
jgi:pimeloyl-ACP methyl ester carboxylesterase